MSNTIRIKRSTATAAPTTLANAELAFSENSEKLFIGVGTGGAGGSATSIVAIGGPGAYATLDTAQTISGAKTFTGSVALGSATITGLSSTSVSEGTNLYYTDARARGADEDRAFEQEVLADARADGQVGGVGAREDGDAVHAIDGGGVAAVAAVTGAVAAVAAGLAGVYAAVVDAADEADQGEEQGQGALRHVDLRCLSGGARSGFAISAASRRRVHLASLVYGAPAARWGHVWHRAVAAPWRCVATVCLPTVCVAVRN